MNTQSHGTSKTRLPVVVQTANNNQNQQKYLSNRQIKAMLLPLKTNSMRQPESYCAGQSF